MAKVPDYRIAVVSVEAARFEPASQDRLASFVERALSANNTMDSPFPMSTDIGAKMDIGPAFRMVRPLDDSYKDLAVNFVSVDGSRVVLAGVIEPGIKPGIDGCDFAFSADPYAQEQALKILSGRPGCLRFIVDEVAAGLPRI